YADRGTVWLRALLIGHDVSSSSARGVITMSDLIAASAFFLLIHFGVSGTRLRDALTALLGAGPYRGAFALASLGGLAWMIYAYQQAPAIELLGFLLGFRPAAYVLVFIAFLFAVIGLLTPSPTR